MHRFQLAACMVVVVMLSGVALAQRQIPDRDFDEETIKTPAQVFASIPESIPVEAKRVLEEVFRDEQHQFGIKKFIGDEFPRLDEDAQAAVITFLIEQFDIDPKTLAREHMMHVQADLPQFRAEYALSEMGEAPEPYLILALKHESTNIRLNAVQMLGRFNSPEVVKALSDLLDDENPHIVLAAISSLTWTGEKLPLKPTLTLLKHDQTEIRADAVLLIGSVFHRHPGVDVMDNMAKSEVIDAVADLLNDSDERTRLNAAHILGESGSHNATRHLLAELRKEDSDVRGAVIHALGELGDITATMPLIERYQLPEAENEREAILYAVGQLCDARAVPILVNCLSEKEVWPSVVAARALGDIGSRSAVPALIEALDSEDIDLLKAASRALGQIGDTRATEPLIDLLQHDEASVARQAAIALGKLNDPKAINPLIKMLYRPSINYEYRDRVCEALVAIKDPGVVPALIEGLQEKPSYARLVTYRTLNKLTGEHYSEVNEHTFDRWKQWLKDHEELLEKE